MNWDDYKLGTQWVIEEIESGTSKHDIFQELEEGISMGLEDWVRGAYAILLERGIVAPLDVAQVAEKAGCTRRAVQMAISAGNLKATRIGNSYSIHPLDYENWLNSDSKYKKP